ncbi:MAG TPA: response regulator transcription factor [Flavisolibacter sp.]
MEIRVVIFEDNKLVRDALQAIINGSPGYTCTGAYADAHLLAERIRSSDPDVVLMDIELPGINGIEATAEISMAFPHVKVLIQTVFNDSDKIFRALTAGASGYILKNDPPAKQMEAIHEVFNGGAPMSPAIAKKVLQFFSAQNVILVPPEETHDYQLSEREKEILTMMTQGNNFRTIAASSFISYETVRTHVKHIYRKLHVVSRSEAIMKARQQGLVR